ncbi:MAG: hypothetical protein K9M01_02105 [Candidatus Omnitrophica bacterium]|nr:hypothetical protein [Candidatus Omnitrophota bacterium]
MLNINNCLYLRKALRLHGDFLRGRLEGAKEKEKKKGKKAFKWIEANQMEIKRRVLNSGAKGQIKSYMKPVGLGYGKPEHVNPLDNLLFLNEDILESARSTISLAKGHYWTQAWLSFNPLFWLEMIVFLPREISKMIKFDKSSKLVQNVIQIVQLVYWGISILYIIKLLNK